MTSSSNRETAWLSFTVIAAVLVLLAVSGCSSGTKSGAESASSSGSRAHIDVMCVGDRINNPPESFHYSFKYADASGWVDKEADITPQAMDITIKDTSGSHSYHGTRADEASWNNAVLYLSSLNITAMSARLGSLNGTSSIVSQGAEAMNGYQATKYSIDTTSANASDRKTYETLFGTGSFDKGTIWMGPDACAVKVVLDEAMPQTNGGIEKRHYEISRSLKQ